MVRFSLLPLVVGTCSTFAVLTPPAAMAQTFSVANTGGTISAGGAAQTFQFNVNNTSGFNRPITNVTLNIASLTTAAADLSDIELYLSSPGSAQILNLKDAFSNFGLTAYTNVTFADTAATSIDTAVADPVTGVFQPENGFGTSLTPTITNFAGFNVGSLSPGLNTWTLTAFNGDGANDATLGNTTLNVTAAVPEPEQVAGTLLAGLLGVGAYVARRRKQAVKA